MSDAVTRQIRVRVAASYVPGRSAPHRSVYCFGYRVAIENQGAERVQLLSRFWSITDGVGRVEEVRGPGVVGVQPRLGPGEQFEYASFCALQTPTGGMQGSYHMVNAAGEQFDVRIAPFTLAMPHALN